MKCDILLYAILDPDRCKTRHLPTLAKLAAENGATIIQYRHKQAQQNEMIENCNAIHKVLAPLKVPLLVNDNVEVAKHFDGVHLGQSDMPAKIAREILGCKKIIGLSVSEEKHIENAPFDFIDYIFIGGVFATQSKQNAKHIGIDGWKMLAQKIKTKTPNIPIGAIAGIDAIRGKQLIKAGADGIGVISAIFMQDDVALATQELKNATKKLKQAIKTGS